MASSVVSLGQIKAKYEDVLEVTAVTGEQPRCNLVLLSKFKLSKPI